MNNKLEFFYADEADATIRQAKTSSLVVGLKVCPQKILTDKLQDKIIKCILYTLSVDRVRTIDILELNYRNINV